MAYRFLHKGVLTLESENNRADAVAQFWVLYYHIASNELPGAH